MTPSTKRPEASGLEVLKLQNEQLKSQLMATSVISEITKVMLATPQLDAVFKTLMLGIHETMEFERIILFKVDAEKFSLVPFVWMGIDDAAVRTVKVSLSFLEGGDLADAIFLHRPIIVDPVFPEGDPLGALNSKAYLALPLVAKTQCTLRECPAAGGPHLYCWTVPEGNMGKPAQNEDDRRKSFLHCAMLRCTYVLWLDKPNSKTLATSEDITVLSTLAAQAGIIVDNIQTYEDLEAANTELQRINIEINKINHDLKLAQAKISRDLEHAREIQQGLLPQQLPNTPHFTCAAAYIPATLVGGDYYDVFEIEKDCFVTVVADVSGHGISAALIMSMAKTLIRVYANPDSAKTTLERINRVFNEEIKTENFVTMFLGILDLRKGKLIFSSAGHNPQILVDRRTREATSLKAEGTFLGVFEDAMVQDTVVDIKKDHRIVFYTDGLTEAENLGEEMFGFERLVETAKNTVNLSPSEAQAEIMKALHDHIGKAPVEDDVTLMVMDFN